jgi:DNA-binding winged helix-turn-helix (wHTH) protein
MIYAFGAYTLDTDRYELREAGKLCALEPHAVDILAYLLQHRERVVTKQELLEHLWPKRFVGEGILAQRLMMIRKAIGDSGRSQRCIKTLHGRGYRFAAAVAVHANALGPAGSAAMAGAGTARHADERDAAVPVPSLASLPAPLNLASPGGPGTDAIPRRAPPPLFSRPPHFGGRDAELAQLAQWWTRAQQGARQVGFIVGEAGIGKTALVDAFVAQVASTENIWVGRGQCMDHYGTGEPYLPVLEALGRLCRDADGDRFVSCLRHYAPRWLAHLPAQLAPADRDALVRTTHDATPARMLRELTDALEVLTAARPLVLVLEDLHWSDRATLGWLAYLARRRDPAHVLVLGTYRPGEVVGQAHPLRPLRSARPQAQCELMLDALSAPAVAAYLSERCTPAMLPASLLRFIHRRTSGHPLFLVAMVDELVRQRRLEAVGAAAASEEDLAALSEFVPANLREYIEQQLERLSDTDQALLAAASTAGSTFALAAVAAGVAQAPATIEARYAAFARQGQFIRPCGIEAWPDGTVSACYQFKHALYHEVAYARVHAEQRMHLHSLIGKRKEAGYGAQARQIAAELAVHFARGGDARRAVHYLHCAAENALHRSAYQEAITHLTQGLETLTSLPDCPDRTQHELGFLTTLGLALVATKGQAHADVERNYARARTLCHRLGAPAQLFQVLWGLFSFHVVRAQLPAAWDVGQQLLALAEGPPDTSLRMVAHFALGQTLLFQGNGPGAHALNKESRSTIRKSITAERAGRVSGNLGVFCRCFAAHTLWHLGYPTRRSSASTSAAQAQELAHPFSRPAWHAAMLYQFRREEHLAHEAAEAVIACANRVSVPPGVGHHHGWGGRPATGRRGNGADAPRHGRDAATGAAAARAVLSGFAGRARADGSAEAGLTMLAEGLTEAHRHGECWEEAELHVQGQLCCSATRRPMSVYRRPMQQWSSFTAPRSRPAAGARSLGCALRWPLARVWQGKGNRVAAYGLLAPIYDWFTEASTQPICRMPGFARRAGVGRSPPAAERRQWAMFMKSSSMTAGRTGCALRRMGTRNREFSPIPGFASPAAE